MVFPRSIRDVAVLLVDLVAWPVNRAIDSLDLSDIGDDEVEDPRPCKGRNANICVGEGCYGEACRKVYGK